MVMVTAEEACHDGGMSERFTIARTAGPDTVYAASAGVSLAGTTTRVKLPGGREVEGLICAAVASEDGSEIEITVEVPDGTLPRLPLAGFSISR
jgi:hypothetical protein